MAATVRWAGFGVVAGGLGRESSGEGFSFGKGFIFATALADVSEGERVSRGGTSGGGGEVVGVPRLAEAVHTEVDPPKDSGVAVGFVSVGMSASAAFCSPWRDPWWAERLP